MGRNDTTIDAANMASEDRINRRRSTTRDRADAIVHSLKNEAKAKGIDLKLKAADDARAAKDTAAAAKDKAHHAKEAAKEKGREAQDTVQDWMETAKDKACLARDVLMGKTRYVRSGAHDVAEDAADVLRRPARKAGFTSANAVHPSLSGKTTFILIAAVITVVALLLGARAVERRRNRSTFQRAKEALFGRPSMVEEAKDIANDALKNVKAATTDKVFDAAHYAKVKGENAVLKSVEMGEDAADIAGGAFDASRKVASTLATRAYEYVMGKADEAKDATSDTIHKLAKHARV